MHWLQPNDDGTTDLRNLQLDIVGFLAILGEGSVLANAQVSTLSRWIFLPRLIPAPQALMRPTRPSRLEPVPGHVSGIFSGNYKDNINHIGNIVCDASNLAPFSVRVVEIKRTSEQNLKSKSVAPLTVVLLLGFALSALLLAISIWREDGFSIVATILLSLLSSLIGYGNKWTLRLPKRNVQTGKVPRGDVVIRYPKGSFLVVRCDENVARELYFAPESIEYLLTHGPAYRILSLIGTMMLMGGVICLANAQIQVQIAWAASYMLLGSAYWIVAALPGKLHWDTSCYTVTNECLSDSSMEKKGYPSENKTFTQALWKAIVVSKDTAWVRRSAACPETRAWEDWLNAARACSKDVRLSDEQKCTGIKTWEVPEWDPQAYLAELLDDQAKTDDKGLSRPGIDEV
ncbi:Nn.00g103910.m01.CDS01 [Neocucurbitaria sp. VM-36]